jgi:ABC-type dipeptide/oligopeptide/nickel transport system permease subunit
MIWPAGRRMGAAATSAGEAPMARAAPGGGAAEELDQLELMTEEDRRTADREPPRIEGRSPFRLAMERFRRDKVAMASVTFIVLLALFALTAPLIAKAVGHPPNDQSHLYEMTTEGGLPKGPNLERKFFFGADQYGRDLLVRIAYGARISLIVGIVATGLALLMGVTIGLLTGFYGGWIDTVLSRFMDVLLSIPLLLLALALVAVFRPSLQVIIAVIVFVSWTYIARIIRGQVLSLREKEFVEAQHSLGAGNLRIIFRDVLPNLVASILIYATLIIPANILFEAYLSFLGLGVPPPTATWGQMLSDATDYYRVAWWMLLFPGVALLGTTLAFNLAGDGLRDALDPRGQQVIHQ